MWCECACVPLQAAKQSGSNQVRAYNHFVAKVATEWVSIQDLDEYIFGVNTTIAHFLHQLALSTRQVCMPWITFGSGNLSAQPACVTASNVYRRGIPDKAGKCIMRTRELAHAEIHRSVMLNETYHRRVDGCICGNCRRCACCGHTGPSPAFACSAKGYLQTKTPHLRLHHYISQSREHMHQKSMVGEADLYNRVRTPAYWDRIEAISNTHRDAALADQAVCRPGQESSLLTAW